MGVADFLISKREQQILVPFFLHPERTFTLTDFVKSTGGGNGSIQRILNTLHESNVILDERKGRQREYRVNKGFPLFQELRSICIKSFGIKERLAAALGQFGALIKYAFIFGSIAKGTDRADSDIDLFVVGDLDLFEMNDALERIEKDLGRPIHANLYGSNEFESALRDSVISGIVNGPKIMVIGDASAIERAREPPED